jgi:hypothetical protein
MRFSVADGEIELSLAFGVDGSVWLLCDRVYDGVIADNPDDRELSFQDEDGFASSIAEALRAWEISTEEALSIATKFASSRWPPAPMNRP